MADLAGYAHTATKPPRRPVLVWDGACDLCAAWMVRFHACLDSQVDAMPYQSLGNRFPQLSETQCVRAVHLIDSDGRVSGGAAAVYHALAIAGRRKGLWLYRHLPGYAALTEYLYRQVARHRRAIYRVVYRWWGRHAHRRGSRSETGRGSSSRAHCATRNQ
jgi:predicted DCC family thiol-disulfide oxidoreductase YuxK